MNYYIIPGLLGTEEILLQKVCKFLNISKERMMLKRRFKDVVFARYLYCYVLHEYTELTLLQIGELMGYDDHTTPIHGISVIEDDLNSPTERGKIANNFIINLSKSGMKKPNKKLKYSELIDENIHNTRATN